ncbi:uncharacterized protein [Spinacia oleracea]|uniref:RNase H type-1 domain-containing protein n=1 Tax=Spinacia oleracea TaxID=3562 RepID=A0A9R0I286_SPIOL|nr:uncharacterized protein LOC110781330 [Spinacia oleracea]
MPGDGTHIVPTPLAGSDSDLRVSALISYEQGDWDTDVLDATFMPEDRTKVLTILLSRSFPSDNRYWWPNSNDKYTVRTGYWLGRLGCLEAWNMFHGETGSKLVWGLSGPPKLHHFLRRACKGSLGTMEVLHRRHVRPSPQCGVCEQHEETINHSLFECKHASLIWTHSEFAALLEEAPTESFATRFRWFADQLTRDRMQTFAFLVWAAWLCRNKACFEPTTSLDAISVAAGFVKLNDDYCSYNVKVIKNAPGVLPFCSEASWYPPPNDTVKVNVDAHIMKDIGVSFGVAIRDGAGSLILEAVKRMNAQWQPEMGEAGAVRYGLEVARRFGFEKVVLECDATSVVRTLHSKEEGDAPIFFIFDDIRRLSYAFSSFMCNSC